MSEVEEDARSDVSDLEKDNKGNTTPENLQKQRLHLEEQLKQQVQQMTPAKESNNAKANKNMLSVPVKKNRKGKDVESASDMSSAEESEELNTDDSADATNEEESENDTKLENVTRERRQSNLVRINTQTKWSDDQMDALKGELLDQISQMAAQNAQKDANSDAYPNYHTNHYNPQHTNGQLNNNFEQLNGATSMQINIEERNSATHYVTTSKQGDSWSAPQMSEREREMLAQIEYLKMQNAQLQAAQNSNDAGIGNTGDAVQTSSNATEPQQSVEAYNVKDAKQALRPHSIQSEIKEPLLESGESHPKTNSNTCCCAVL